MTEPAPTSSPPSGRAALAAWAQLLRLPNLFTVPGDPLAGFALAGGLGSSADLPAVLPCAAASLLLYCAGVILNDLFDRNEDARDRPTRPLPAGEIRPAAALAAAAVLAAGAVAIAATVSPLAGVVAAMLTLLVVVYDAGGKRIRLLGPINMGLCRGLSLLLGAVAAGGHAAASTPVAIACGALTGYIALVTYLAGFEAGRAHSTGPLKSVPPEAVRKAIGRMIRLLVVYQAAVVATAGTVGCIVAGCLLAGGAASVFLVKRFYAS